MNEANDESDSDEVKEDKEDKDYELKLEKISSHLMKKSKKIIVFLLVFSLFLFFNYLYNIIFTYNYFLLYI